MTTFPNTEKLHQKHNKIIIIIHNSFLSRTMKEVVCSQEDLVSQCHQARCYLSVFWQLGAEGWSQAGRVLDRSWPFSFTSGPTVPGLSLLFNEVNHPPIESSCNILRKSIGTEGG